MKKQAIGMLLVIAAIAAVGLVTLPAMTHLASAAGSSAGASFHDSDSAASTASNKGPSRASDGPIAVCEHFTAIRGSCSESAP